MHEVFKYAEAIIGDAAKEKEFKHITCAALERMKKHDPEEYYAIVYKLHCLAYGPHFDECTAKEAVAEMKNVDGTKGEHWTIEQTDVFAQQHGVTHKADFYYALNSLRSDLYNIVGNDANMYIKLAKALYFDDPDAPEGKVFKTWLAKMYH